MITLPCKAIRYLTAMFAVLIVLFLAAVTLAQAPPTTVAPPPWPQPPLHTNAVFPCLDTALPHYAGAPIRNWWRVNVFGLQPLTPVQPQPFSQVPPQ